MSNTRISNGYPRLLFFVNATIPALLLGLDTMRGRLGTNPPEYLIRTTGMLTLIFVAVTLSIRPAMKLSGIAVLIRLRRMAGLFAFFYGCLHALSYSWFDKGFNFGAIFSDVRQRPFIFLGMFAFLAMMPLAITSTRGMVKRLGGRRWKIVHRTIYAIAIAGSAHYYLLVRADKQIPVAFGVVIACLLIWRLREMNQSG
jgi:sulfoxide reductase heme-binding subunit YedZ